MPQATPSQTKNASSQISYQAAAQEGLNQRRSDSSIASSTIKPPASGFVDDAFGLPAYSLAEQEVKALRAMQASSKPKDIGVSYVQLAKRLAADQLFMCVSTLNPASNYSDWARTVGRL